MPGSCGTQRLQVDIGVFAARPGVTPGRGQLATAGDLYCGDHLQRLRTLRRAGENIDELYYADGRGLASCLACASAVMCAIHQAMKAN